MTLRRRVRAFLSPETSERVLRPSDASTAVGLVALPSPLENLPAETRKRLRECADAYDLSETSTLNIAVRELWTRLRAEEIEG